MKFASCVATVLVAAILPARPVGAATVDSKSVHGSECVAAGANTTPAELTKGAYGIANPGTTDELVICPMPIDAESAWGNPDNSAVEILFRAGSVPGRIICTAFNGAAGAQDSPVESATSTSDTRPANSSVSQLVVPIPPPNWSSQSGSASAVSVACILGPKVKLGGLFLSERVATHTP